MAVGRWTARVSAFTRGNTWLLSYLQPSIASLAVRVWLGELWRRCMNCALLRNLKTGGMVSTLDLHRNLPFSSCLGPPSNSSPSLSI